MFECVLILTIKRNFSTPVIPLSRDAIVRSLSQSAVSMGLLGFRPLISGSATVPVAPHGVSPCVISSGVLRRVLSFCSRAQSFRPEAEKGERDARAPQIMFSITPCLGHVRPHRLGSSESELQLMAQESHG
jgi:hypothetical protein